MPALLEAIGHAPPLSIKDLARISRQLADDVSGLPARTEGYSPDDYLSLAGNYLVEFVHGCLQVLPMPSGAHQDLTGEFYDQLKSWAKIHDPLARVRFAPFRVAVSEHTYREPDVCLSLGRHAAQRFPLYWAGADLVLEVLSDGNRRHDEVTKRREYAEAGVPEYWIVDPDVPAVRVLTLPPAATAYALHGEFTPGQSATGVLLPTFAINVSALFAAAERAG